MQRHTMMCCWHSMKAVGIKAQARLVSATRSVACADQRDMYHPLSLESAIIPLLSFASVIYFAASRVRQMLYSKGILHVKRIPVPVISIGNVTWGGNGKTPMAEYVAKQCLLAGCRPLILERGYGGGDEVRLLRRRLNGTTAVIGVGKDRAKVASEAIHRYGAASESMQADSHGAPDQALVWRDLFRSLNGTNLSHRGGFPSSKEKQGVDGDQQDRRAATVPCCCCKDGIEESSWQHAFNTSLTTVLSCTSSGAASSDSEGFRGRTTVGTEGKFCCAGDGIGVAILDDGMQHWRVGRDLEIVMVNALSPWGNGRTVPRGPLRENPSAIGRADVVAIHHSDLVSKVALAELVKEVTELAAPAAMVIKTAMIPTYFIRLRSPTRGTTPPPSSEHSFLTGNIPQQSCEHGLFSAGLIPDKLHSKSITSPSYWRDSSSMNSGGNLHKSHASNRDNHGKEGGYNPIITNHEEKRIQINTSNMDTLLRQPAGRFKGGTVNRNSCEHEQRQPEEEENGEYEGEEKADDKGEEKGKEKGKEKGEEEEEELAPLTVVQGAVVLSVSGIGCPSSFNLNLKRLGALHVDALDLGDHHRFTLEDAENVKRQLGQLEKRFDGQKKVLLVMTEKDYMRDKYNMQRWFGPMGSALVLSAELQIIGDEL